ncbi:YheT family hydrolase [Tenacibaculum sp. IB213877]|uniref:YheT family hydrolase n=1 Tax=Tenacibaculum sp. IB213877 TaxID=3097351 RepID=UPI002A5A9ACF|nr:alpha/beta fold hydrolase [Tenacibaculum sp. IB213877]MDY0779614.1 alpha/beta fold hydrolase [Tenacibaculum sp. IB213877]
MPILTTHFTPSLPFKSAHFNTLYRPLFMKDECNYSRKRITTWDNDFIDLDFSCIGSKTLILLIHGLEGSSNSNYMITTANELNKHCYDAVCMNLRGCSGEDNLLLGTYHSGKTDDIDFVINYLTSNYTYDNIIICGFSLGGNLTLKYLGEYSSIPTEVKGGIAVSVPIDLTSSQAELGKLKNKIYMKEFLRTMKLKILEKSEKFPDFELNKELLFKASKFKHIEKQFTVPVFGFKSSEDYWKRASCKPFIPKIQHKALLINALDDSFLSEKCFPTKFAENMDNFYLMMPKYGGHVGFISSFTGENRWLENKIVHFIKEYLNIHSNKQ